MISSKEELIEIWTSLEGQATDQAAKAIVFWKGGLILASINSLGLPSLIVEVANDGIDFDLQVQGLDIVARQLELSGRLADCIQITPSKEENKSLFYTLAQYLAQELAALTIEIGSVHVVESIILDWVEFLKELHGAKPREKIIGLIGELLAIRDIIDTTNLSPVAWQGPLGGIQDFGGSRDLLEVKTATNRNGAIHHKISGLFQLLPPKEGRLYVQSFRISLGQNEQEKLSDLIEQVRANSMFSTWQGQKHFDECLSAAGYTPDLDGSLSEFTLLGSKTYLVSEGFPRLDAENHKLDSRILGITYSLDFSQLDEFSVGPSDVKLVLE